MDRTRWNYKKIIEVTTFFDDGDWIESDDQSDSGIRLIQTGNIGNGFFVDKSERAKYISENTFKRLRCKKIYKGDCLISRLPDPIGRSCIVPDVSAKMITAVDCSILRFKDIINPYFFVYVTQSKFYKEQINKFSTGATRKRISRKNLGTIITPLPPINVQQTIVAELDKLNEVIALKHKQLADLDSLAQSLFYEMFGDPVVNEQGWEVKKLDTLCTHIVDCPHSTPKKVDKITPYPCIRTSELKGGNISWDTMQYLEKDEYDVRIARLKPEAGDIVFGREGTIGDAVILPKGYFFSLGQRTMLLRTNESMVTNTFLHRVILSEWVKKQIRSVNVSSTVAHVNIKDFKLFDIPLPPLPLQKSFATKIAKIEAEKQRVKSSLKDLETLLASRMQYWFDN